MKLNLFADTGVDESQFHPKYKFLSGEPSLFGEREVIQAWTDNFIDRDNKIVKEFQTTFHSAFWEFFLHKLLTDSGYAIDFQYNRPDFIVKGNPDIHIENVVSEIKKDGRHEGTRTLEDILSMSCPPHLQEDYKELIDEAVVRNSNAIVGKSRKYIESYSKLTWVEDNSPFVIAMASYDQVNYGREYHYAMLALLFGKYYDPQRRDFDKVNAVVKPGTTSEIPVGLFHDTAYNHISAIIFTCTLTLGKLTSLYNSSSDTDCQINTVLNIRHDFEEPFYKLRIAEKNTPEELSDGIFIFHNPNAKNPLPENFLASTNAIQVREYSKGFHFCGEDTPLVSRLNLPKWQFTESFMNQIFDRYNS